jgi:hypothetical protein
MIQPIRIWCAGLVGVFVSTCLFAQVPITTTVSSTSQSIALATAASLALNGGVALSDLTITATASAASVNGVVSGNATLEFRAGVGSRLQTNIGSTRRTEIRNNSGYLPAGAWIDPDGIHHRMALHNCWIPVAPLVPHATVAQMLATDGVLSYVGPETRAGRTTDHLQMVRNIPAKTPATPDLLKHLATSDVYLDGTTHLPLVLRFNLHPDNDAGLDVPVEIRFSNYQQVNGVNVPFRIQQYERGALVFDFSVTGASVNTGLPDSAFALQ